MLVAESRQKALQSFVQPHELRHDLAAMRFRCRLTLPERFVALLVQQPRFIGEALEQLQMPLPFLVQLVNEYPVKPFSWRHGEKFLRQGHVFFGRESKAVNNPARLLFGLLDSLANFHLLLPRQ